MFSDLLPLEEAQILVRAMTHIAMVDGEMTFEEKELLDAAARKIGMAPQYLLPETIDETDLKTLLKTVQSEQSKRIILQELITLGYADGHYFHLEKAKIEEIAAILGVDQKTLDNIENWIVEGVAWSKKGYRMIVKGAPGSDA